MATLETTSRPRAPREPCKLLRRASSFPVLLVVAVVLVARAFCVGCGTWWHLVVGQRILSVQAWGFLGVVLQEGDERWRCAD